ncbi:16S rRNA (cytidine(1402)-2'-O)-methyltransferase [Spiroplasma tabanidicola]|uniref:16S rRNA (Cytidine1402-2'-O)-methyltransferase n=1 Tax=Spiroplasma tabanidicola TaxID=324079 RepID=A0A6I6C7B1_9MOLU|nr:16S rRNA (cytidine(1402)-2'-O)-methyltransferase [Spiroplasma tabanidicola]QGS51686.1 16S rRNA (cytidine1402-2'-O)-methyltransferase [Spiroplasma tabanidicola]
MVVQKTFKDKKPIIYLVGTPIGNINDFSFRAINILKEVNKIYCEDTRTSKTLLDNYKIKNNLIALHKFNENFKTDNIKNDIENNLNIAIISDAGVPGISDPGLKILNNLSQEILNFSISAVNCGPAYIHALVISGFDFVKNCFLGFLSKKPDQISEQVLNIVKSDKDIVISFYESVHRIVNTMNVFFNILNHNVEVTICRELTKVNEEIIRGSLKEVWNYVNSDDFVKKGEFVVVLNKGAVKKEKKIILDDLIEEVDILIDNGLAKKDAIKEVAKKFGINKNSLYNEFHKK